MSSDKQIEAAKKFVASLTGEYSMPADAYVALAELRQALAAHEAEKQAVEHRPGCDALGGYGHGVGACNCGADKAEKQAGPVAGQASSVAPAGWMIRDRSDLEPGAIDIEGPGYSRMNLTKDHGNPAWRTLYALASALLAGPSPAAAHDTTPPSPLAEQDKVDAELLDWLESEVKQRGMRGVSFDYANFAEDGLVVEKGYRFMRRHFLGDRCKTLREAIRAARAKKEQP